MTTDFINEYRQWINKQGDDRITDYQRELFNLGNSTRDFLEVLDFAMSDSRDIGDEEWAYSLNSYLADMMTDCAELMQATIDKWREGYEDDK